MIGGYPAAVAEVCYEVGEIRESGASKTVVSMCAGNDRQRVVYISTGNDVIVQFLSQESLRGLAPFIVKYEGVIFYFVSFKHVVF